MGEPFSEGLCVLNSGLGINPPFSFCHAVLSDTYSDIDETYQFDLSFEDYRGTVTDAVYGTFNLMMGEYSYVNGFEWTVQPKAAGEIKIEEGQSLGSATVEIPETDKKYAFYAEGPLGYMDFRIDEDSNYDRLVLSPGKYFVMVRGTDPDELGSYGVIVRKLETISGTVSLPNGITLSKDLTIEVSLIERLWDGEDEEYYYDYAKHVRIDIPAGQLSTDYEIISDSDSSYFIEYYIRYGIDDCVYTGYYSRYGTVAAVNNSTQVAEGAKDIDMTLIPISTVDDNERNTFEDADEAAHLKLGEALNGVMKFDGDVDLYKLSVTEEGSYAIGTITDPKIRTIMYTGVLYDSEGYRIYNAGYTSRYDVDGLYRYGIFNLTPGDYYYAAYGYSEPFNVFNYKVLAKETYIISGSISLPPEIAASDFWEIEITAEDLQGIRYNTYCYIGEFEGTGDSIEYAIGVPSSSGYTVSYFFDDSDGDFVQYAEEGYYSTGGTKADTASATPVNAITNISGINMAIITAYDNEGNSLGTATQIGIDTFVEGRINSADDEDYFKFTVPQGGGYYCIDNGSEEYVAIYLKTDEDWILYDEGYGSFMYGFFSEGDYYLKIRLAGHMQRSAGQLQKLIH